MSGQRSILRSRDEQLVTRARVCFRAEKPITTVHVDTKLLLPTFMYIANLHVEKLLAVTIHTHKLTH